MLPLGRKPRAFRHRGEAAEQRRAWEAMMNPEATEPEVKEPGQARARVREGELELEEERAPAAVRWEPATADRAANPRWTTPAADRARGTLILPSDGIPRRPFVKRWREMR